MASAVLQSPEEALAQDLALVAEAKRWTIEEAAADHSAAKVIGAIAQEIYRLRPEIFIGSALAPEPGGPPSLYIKGAADAFVRGVVARAALEIRIVDDQPFSFDELEERKLRVHQALVALGFEQVSTGVNIAGGGTIPAGVLRTPGVTDDTAEILSALPSDLRSSVALTVNDSPMIGEDIAFGGMRTRSSSGFVCTSGWSVQGAFGRGVTDAGHCGGMNQIVDPATGQVWTLTFRGEHLGQWGDVEWFTSNTNEEPQFYADATNIRGVLYVEPRASISLNETVCLYGRSSNVRNCSLEVQDTSQICTNAGITYDRLVLMNGDIGEAGDSGGGWSFDFTAYGGHHGPCGGVPGRDAFSVVDLFDEALAVQVLIYE